MILSTRTAALCKRKRRPVPKRQCGTEHDDEYPTKKNPRVKTLLASYSCSCNVPMLLAPIFIMPDLTPHMVCGRRSVMEPLSITAPDTPWATFTACVSAKYRVPLWGGGEGPLSRRREPGQVDADHVLYPSTTSERSSAVDQRKKILHVQPRPYVIWCPTEARRVAFSNRIHERTCFGHFVSPPKSTEGDELTDHTINRNLNAWSMIAGGSHRSQPTLRLPIQGNQSHLITIRISKVWARNHFFPKFRIRTHETRCHMPRPAQ